MAILITGGTGFLGTVLAQHLINHGEGPIILFDIMINEANVAGLPKDVAIVRGDQSQFVELVDVINRYKVKKIVHLGYAIAELVDQPERSFEVNIQGTNQIFQIARILGLRVVWASSGAAYGYYTMSVPGEMEPLSEDAPMRPDALYGKCKLFNELVAEDYATRFGLDHIGFRLTSIYGIGRSARRQTAKDYYSLLIENALEGKPYTAPPADQMFNWTYVEDVATAFRVALNAPKPKSRIFNVSGDARTVEQSVKFVQATLAPGADISYGDTYSRRIPIITNDLIKRELGWEPRFSMEQGMLDYKARFNARAGN